MCLYMYTHSHTRTISIILTYQSLEWRLEWRKALRRNWWGVGWNGPDLWKEREMKNWQREQMPRKWREKGGEEDRKCDGRTALREIGRVGEEWRTTATYRRSWRLLIENIVREKWGEERKDNEKMTVTMATSPLKTGTTRGEEPYNSHTLLLNLTTKCVPVSSWV